FRQGVEWAGPRVQVDAFAVVQGPQAVVETADRQVRVRVAEAAVQFRQRAIAGGAIVPAGQVIAQVFGQRAGGFIPPDHRRQDAVNQLLDRVESRLHLPGGGDQISDLPVSRLDRADQVFENLFRVALFEQELQALL